MRTAIIGLGVLGAAAARALTLGGARVTVFERTAPGAGTTGTSYGWVNAHRKRPRAYHDLNVAGMAEHEALACHIRSGLLEWAGDEPGQEQLGTNIAELRDFGYPLELITRSRAAELAPDLLIPPDVTDLVHYPTEGYAPPIPLLARLWSEARAHGAELRCPADVTALEPNGTGVRIHVAGADPEHFDQAVLTVGRWTQQLTASIEPTIPMIAPDDPASPGLLAYTAPLAAHVPLPVITPALNLRPDGGGRFVLHALDRNAPEPDDTYTEELLRRLRTLVRGGEHARIEQVRLGLRSLPADGHTVAGPDTSGRVYILATHSGVTLGPLLGRLAAQEILTSESAPLLDAFRPARFAGRTSFAPLEPARHAGEQ